MVKLSLVVPCYNESAVIKDSHERLMRMLEDHYQSFELIYIDDGSSDNTFSLLTDLSSEEKRVKLIKLSRNFGHQNAVCAGLTESEGEYTVIIDADMQDPPEIIPAMLEEMISQKADVSYGVRRERKGEGFLKKFTAKLFYRFLNLISDYKIPPDTGDFRIISRKVLDEFNKLDEKNRYIRGLISWMGYRQVPYYYDRDPRLAGETKYSLKKMLNLAMNGLLGFSKKPLIVVMQVGFFTIIISLLFFIWILGGYLLDRESLAQGWPSVIATIIFLGGVQLLSLGIIGLYIGNIFDEVKKRPNYIVDEND